MSSQEHSEPSDFFKPATMDDVVAIFPTFPGNFSPVQSSYSSGKLYARWGSWAYLGGCCSKERDWGRWVVWRGGWREWEYLRGQFDGCLLCRALRRGNSNGLPFIHLLTGNFSGLLFRSKPFPGVMLSLDTPFRNATRKKTEVPSWGTLQLHRVWEPTNGYTSPGIYFHSEQGVFWVSTLEFHATGTH